MYVQVIRNLNKRKQGKTHMIKRKNTSLYNQPHLSRNTGKTGTGMHKVARLMLWDAGGHTG